MSRSNHIHIRNLPIEERAPFSAWLKHQACPVLSDVPDEEQDGAYLWDYARWLALWKQTKIAVSPQRPDG